MGHCIWLTSLCFVEETPTTDRDVGFLDCCAIAVIALQRGDGCGFQEPLYFDKRMGNNFAGL